MISFGEKELNALTNVIDFVGESSGVLKRVDSLLDGMLDFDKPQVLDRLEIEQLSKDVKKLIRGKQ